MLGKIFLEEVGDKRRAYRQFLRIAEQYPDDLDTRVKLAEIAVSIGSIDEVNRHGAHAETLAPEDPRVQAIKLMRSYNDMSRSDDEAARREVLRQATEMLKDQPDSIFLRVVRVDGAVRENNFSDALSDIDWMLERDPDNQQILSQRLNVLAQLGDMDGVEAQLKDMIVRFPDNDAHKATLVRFYLSREDLDSAEAFLRSGLPPRRRSACAWISSAS